MTPQLFEQLKTIDKNANYHFKELQKLLNEGFALAVKHVDGNNERSQVIAACECEAMREKLIGQRNFHYMARRIPHRT